MVGKAGRSGRKPAATATALPAAEPPRSERRCGRPKKENEPPQAEKKRQREDSEENGGSSSTSEPEAGTSSTSGSRKKYITGERLMNPRCHHTLNLKDKVIGHSIERLSTCRLPSKRDVMQMWRNLCAEGTGNLSISVTRSNASIASEIAEEVLGIWERASIPTIRFDKIKERILKTLTRWNEIRRLQESHAKCTAFSTSLDQLFDIAPADVEERLNSSSNPTHIEDLAFYRAQLNDTRSSSMAGIDTKHSALVLRRQRREKEAETRRQCEQERKAAAQAYPPPRPSDQEDQEGEEEAGEPADIENEYEPVARTQKALRRKADIIPCTGVDRKKLLKVTTQVATRYHMSATQHLAMVSATVVAAGGDMSEVVASPATINRHRKSDQKEKAAEIRAKKTKPKYPVVHWDGKILDYALGMHDDCNAVVLSGPGDCPPTFLGAPIVKRGTGQELCTKCLEILAVYDIPIESIIAAVFDTTASNTGIQQGCCTRLEQTIQHAILWNACRHHMAELHVKHMWSSFMPATKGPEEPMFKRFQNWYLPLARDAAAAAPPRQFPDPNVLVRWEWPADFTSSPHIGPYSITTTLALASKEWARAQLEANTFEREDYRELTESIYFYLGGDVPRGFRMRRPGAKHSARFMASSIYLLKMQLLSSIWVMTAREQTVVEKMAQIVALLYGPYYLKSRISTSAPRHDLEFYYSLLAYISVEPAAARKGLDSVRRHMWYLVPEQVVLCLFDDMVSDKEKKKVADALVALPAPRYFAPGKPNFQPVIRLLTDTRPSLAVFVTERSWLFFKLFRLDTAWLLTEPATWPLSPAYQELRDLTRDMKVVNDSAERAVKDVQEYANMTRDAGHIDDVILVGIDHRCRLSHLRKADLNDII